MRKSLLYIAGITILASCSDDVESPYLNGVANTPISIETNLSVGATTTTRAINKKWENGDKFFAVIETRQTDESEYEYSDGGRYYTINKDAENTSGNITSVDNIGETNAGNITPTIFWDDYSSTSYDLREKGASDQLVRGIRLFYGFCFNGATEPSGEKFDKTTGKVTGWSIETDQTNLANQKKSDLLFAETQSIINYVRDDLKTLTIPFTHAMSKITVNLVCGEGFVKGNDDLANAAVTLQGVNTSCTVTAPTSTVSSISTPDNIKMLPEAVSKTDGHTSRAFTAIIAPTVLKDDKDFLEITGVDGNTYYVSLSDAIINEKEAGTPTTKSDAWSTQLVASDAGSVTPKTGISYNSTNGGLTKPGVNYLLTVNVSKQKIFVSATIQDWDVVSAKTDGVISFANDITTTGNLNDQLLKDNGFDVYKSANVEAPSYDKITTYTYRGDLAEWSRDNEIYWPNGTDRLYFRALSPTTTTTTMTNGSDVLWGTTSAYTWGTGTDKDVAKGAPVHPRTGDVPLEFEHVMAKITFNLIDANKGATVAAGTPELQDPRLNLDGATIQITNMSTGGTINLHDGSITPSTSVTKMLSEVTEGADKRYGYYSKENNGTATGKTEYVLDNYVVVPQTIGDESYIVVTLADGTTYKAKLKDCIVTASNNTDKHAVDSYVTSWLRGNHYTYTITLTKEGITLSALIRDWEKYEVGGNATLEW